MPISASWAPCAKETLPVWNSLARLVTALAVGAWAMAAHAQDTRFFQLGAGPTGETRFTVGALIASAVSNPPGSRPCERGGSCGVPGLLAVARSTAGSVANVDAIRTRRIDAALVHADIAYWAYHGTGIYAGKGAVENLRGVAMLYPESLHLVVRRDGGIRTVADLRGKRVSLGGRDSVSLIHGRRLLAAFGLRERQLRLKALDPGPAADAMAQGELDAFLVVDAPPVPAVADLARRVPIAVVPLAGPEVERLRAREPFLTPSAVPAGAYAGVDAAVPTLSVGMALVTGSEQPADLIEDLTRALWHPSTRRLLAEGFPRAGIGPDASAIQRLGIPLHGGAAAAYFDMDIPEPPR